MLGHLLHPGVEIRRNHQFPLRGQRIPLIQALDSQLVMPGRIRRAAAGAWSSLITECGISLLRINTNENPRAT